jgi:hypothetical protein
MMHDIPMRTTIDLQPDVEKAIDQVRKSTGKGLSETVNELVRAGLVHQSEQRTPFVQKAYPMGLRIDVSNVAEALELLEDS